jgi:hypothetical protein
MSEHREAAVGLLEELRQIIEGFMRGPDNRIELSSGETEPAFDLPLLGVAAGDDPMWLSYKDLIDPDYFTPQEAFALAYPEQPACAAELWVLSWVLPQTKATRKDQAGQKDMTAERWARSRIFGENNVNSGLRRHLTSQLVQRGIAAVAPQLLPQWRILYTPQEIERASLWSERHTAHTAGLGTFGLCDGLITPLGKAHRLGSIVIRHPLPVTPRPYRQYNEYCLFFSTGQCRACIKRCPAGALSEKGHDKTICANFLWGKTKPYVQQTWHFDGYGCGLCQVGVPCESQIPLLKPAPRRAGDFTYE